MISKNSPIILIVKQVMQYRNTDNNTRMLVHVEEELK